MRRVFLYIIVAAILILTGLLPLRGTDVAQLLPVQVMLVEREDGLVRIRCDHGAAGSGENWEQALQDLRASAEGEVFFGTVEHVVLAKSAGYLMPRIAASADLRPAAKLYFAQKSLPEPEQAAAFLHAHPGSLTLGGIRAALLAGEPAVPPQIICKEGRLLLAG